METRTNLEIALGALADIGYSENITLERATRKARRIYQQLSKEEVETRSTTKSTPPHDPKGEQGAAIQGEDWERWVRTLCGSTNPKDIDLLIAKLHVLISSERDLVRKETWKEFVKKIDNIMGEFGDSPTAALSIIDEQLHGTQDPTN